MTSLGHNELTYLYHNRYHPSQHDHALEYVGPNNRFKAALKARESLKWDDIYIDCVIATTVLNATDLTVLHASKDKKGSLQ